MIYKNVTEGRFIKRPNRFIARVRLQGEEISCHVKNTGRCRELLIPGCLVGLEKSANLNRKTAYDLVSVQKHGRWVNMDSQMANLVAGEWLREGELFPKASVLRPEVRYGNSRFDFYLEEGKRKIFLEVKGVTLEEEGIARFPDAPTLRGVKHLKELCACIQEGYEAWLLFVIQMKGVREFRPNWATHREFAETLLLAKKAGVKILAYDCQVDMGSIYLDAPVPIVWEEG